jgi:uncharacterized membrane protein
MQKALLMLHLLGLAMGLSVSFSGMIMRSLMASATPDERNAYAKFPPRMMRVGDIGLTLLWITGPAMLFTKYQGFAGQPWTFHVKLTAVVALTAVVGMIHANAKKAAGGDVAAARRIETIAPLAFVSAVTALVFAVITFEV